MNDETIANLSALPETKNEAFKRVVTKRVNNALSDLALIGQMAGSTAYAYGQEEIDAMFGAIHEAVDEAHQKYVLSLSGKKAKNGFSF